MAVVTETYPPEVHGVAATLARAVYGLHRGGDRLQPIRSRPCPASATPASAAPATACQPAPPVDEVLLRGLPIPRHPGLKPGLPARTAATRLGGGNIVEAIGGECASAMAAAEAAPGARRASALPGA